MDLLSSGSSVRRDGVLAVDRLAVDVQASGERTLPPRQPQQQPQRRRRVTKKRSGEPRPHPSHVLNKRYWDAIRAKRGGQRKDEGQRPNREHRTTAAKRPRGLANTPAIEKLGGCGRPAAAQPVAVEKKVPQPPMLLPPPFPLLSFPPLFPPAGVASLLAGSTSRNPFAFSPPIPIPITNAFGAPLPVPSFPLQVPTSEVITRESKRIGRPETKEFASHCSASQKTTISAAPKRSCFHSRSDEEVDSIADSLMRRHSNQEDDSGRRRLCIVPVPLPIILPIPLSAEFILRHYPQKVAQNLMLHR